MRRVNCSTRSMLGSKFVGWSAESLFQRRDVLTRLAVMCPTCFSSTTLRKWDSATPTLFLDTWTLTPAISSPFPMQLAQNTPWRWVLAELTLLRMSPTLRTQPKVLRRACGRHCRVSWVPSRSTLLTEFTLQLRATVATMGRSSTSRWIPSQWRLVNELSLTKTDTSLRRMN